MKKSRRNFTKYYLLFLAIFCLGILIFFLKSERFFETRKTFIANLKTKNMAMSWINYGVIWYDISSEKNFHKNEFKNEAKISQLFSSKLRNIENNSLQQSEISYQPILLKKSIGDLPTILFDGVDDFMSSKNPIEEILTYNSASFFVVLRQDFSSSDEYRTIFSQPLKCDRDFDLIENFTDENYVFNVTILQSPNNRSHCLFSIAVKGNDITKSAQNLENNQNILVGATIHQEPQMVDLKEFIQFFINGKKIKSSTIIYKNIAKNLPKTDNQPNSQNSAHYFIGKLPSDYNLYQKYLPKQKFFKGEIAEIVVFNRALSNKSASESTDIQSLNEYFGCKWSIPIIIEND